MTKPRKANSIVQDRLLAAAPEEVFEAWSDPEGLSMWMCPAPDMKRASVKLDFRVGGRFEIVMHGSEQEYRHHGEYLEIEAPHRLVMTWVSEWLPKSEQRTRVEVTLTPEAGQTRIRLVHDELPDTDTYEGHDQGWATILEKLAQRLKPEESP